MGRGIQCQVHRHSSVTSEEHHHLQPQSRGGPTKPENMIWLCSNAHGDVHYFLDLIEDVAVALRRAKTQYVSPKLVLDSVPGKIARTYSPAVRRFAAQGWNRYAAEFIEGVYDAHALIWSTSGEPREGVVYRAPFWVARDQNEVETMLSRARLHLIGRGAEVGPL